jgi:hypothetical protein
VEYRKAYYLKNREKIIAWHREYYQKNKEKLTNKRNTRSMFNWQRDIIKKEIPDIYCAFMTGKTSKERGKKGC